MREGERDIDMDGLTTRDFAARAESQQNADVDGPSEAGSNFVATLFASRISSQDIDITISILTEILKIAEPGDFQTRWLSSPERQETVQGRQAVDITFYIESAGPGLRTMRQHPRLRETEQSHGLEIAIQKADRFRREKRLAVFDMDSTLIQQEVIDELARVIGVEKEVSAITERAMNGELDFTASLRARMALLQGVPSRNVWDRLKADVITFTPGARELCKVLKKEGFKLAVLSGGFAPLAEWVKQELGLDYAYANNLVVDPSTSLLTGHLSGPIVDATRKATLLGEIAEREGIPLNQTIAVGDGANDLLMMHKAGVGVAFNAKQKVRQEAPTKITTSTLLDVLYILGYTDKEREEILQSAD